MEDIIGLTLEEAVAYLTPRGWAVTVHRYEDDVYGDEMAPEAGVDTVSLDIQDGKVYDAVVYVSGEPVDIDDDFLL